jgi:hypothetical protein
MALYCEITLMLVSVYSYSCYLLSLNIVRAILQSRAVLIYYGFSVIKTLLILLGSCLEAR